MMMYTRIARVNDLFAEAIAKNKDRTPIVGATKELVENHYVLGVEVPVAPTRLDGRVVAGTFPIMYALSQTDALNTLMGETTIWTERAEYFLRNDNDVFSIGVIGNSADVPQVKVDRDFLVVNEDEAPATNNKPITVGF